MKKKYIAVSIIIAIVVIVITGAFLTVNKTGPGTSPTGFAVVELFTSEGCSSCPSAEETVARLLSKNTENVYILAYHVDYWDRLGWKDPFSKAEYSQRQNQYASVFNLNSVYTPQVIVNGSSQFVGSDENKLNTVVNKNLQKQLTQDIGIHAKRTGKMIAINYDIEGNDVVLLNVALVQAEATISVKKGENGGRTLHHVNIVRTLKTVDAKEKGSLTMEIPTELSATAFQLIAFTQSKKTFEILGADQKPL